MKDIGRLPFCTDQFLKIAEESIERGDFELFDLTAENEEEGPDSAQQQRWEEFRQRFPRLTQSSSAFLKSFIPPPQRSQEQRKEIVSTRNTSVSLCYWVEFGLSSDPAKKFW